MKFMSFSVLLIILLSMANMGSMLKQKQPDIKIEEFTINTTNQINMTALNYYPTNQDSRLIKIVKYGLTGITGIFIEISMWAVETGFYHPFNYFILSAIILFSLIILTSLPFIVVMVMMGYYGIRWLIIKYKTHNQKD